MKQLTWIDILKRMFLDRYCVICGDVVSYEIEEPFCPLCQPIWQDFLKTRCRKCGQLQNQCTCLPSKIAKISHGMASWSVFYDVDNNKEISIIFRYLKRKYDREVIDMCAERMKKNILLMCKNRNIDYKEYTVTYSPRSRNNVLKYGFDQSYKLAKSLSKKLGLKLIKTFNNVGDTEQKGLNKRERIENALKTYEYIDESIGENKKLFLVDDIMTSGATLYACAFQLYKNGARDVVPVVFAKDNYKSKGVMKNVKRNTKYYLSRAFKGSL